MERKNTHPSDRDGFLMRPEYRSVSTTSSDFVLQWGNRKRLRCMKVQPKNNDSNGSASVQRSTTRVDRRVVRSDLNNNNKGKDPNPTLKNNNNNAVRGSGGNSYLNLRHRAASPPHRILRNTESSIGMKGHSNGGVRSFVSPDRGDRKVGNNYNGHNRNCNSNHFNEVNHHCSGGVGGGASGSPDIAHDGSDAKTALWLPTFVFALTNKEKEEDFLAIKGCKLPQRPKKRAKMVQRTLNLVSPGTWLCDLTLERYEVQEKRVSKKRSSRGLKAMGNTNSDSE